MKKILLMIGIVSKAKDFKITIGRNDLIFLIGIVLFCIFQFFIFLALPHPAPTWDALQYIGISQRPLMEILNNDTTNIPWAVPRPELYPIILKLIYSSKYHLQFLFLQFLVLLGCEVLTVSIIYNSYAKKVGAVSLAFAAIMAIYLLSPMIVVWPILVYTEAFSIAILIALFAYSVRDFRKIEVWVVVSSLTALSLLKYVGVYSAVIIIGLLAVIYSILEWKMFVGRLKALVRGRVAAAGGWRTVVILICLILLVNTWWLQEKRHGAGVNIGVVIQMRLLKNPDAINFLHARGMPISPSVMQLSGIPGDNYATEDRRAFTKWFYANGMSAYLNYMLTHPGYVWDVFFKNRSGLEKNAPITHRDFSIPNILNTRYDTGYSMDKVCIGGVLHNMLTTPLTFLVYIFLYSVAVVSIVVGLFFKHRVDMHHVFMVSTLPFMMIAVIGDAWDVWRHVLPSLIMSYMYALVLAFTLIAKALTGEGPRLYYRHPFKRGLHSTQS